VGSRAPPEDDQSDVSGGGRWHLIRDVLVFQLKLVLDGVRDVILSPISLIAALLDLATGGERRNGGAFYSLLRFGHRTDRWINLFGATGPSDVDEAPVVDDLVARLEAALARDVEEGGISATAKAGVDRALDRVQEHSAPRQRTPHERSSRRPRD
jgi:hypothetical protein